MVTADALRYVRSGGPPTRGGVPAFATLLAALVIGAVPAVTLLTGVHPVAPLVAALAGYGIVVLVVEDVVAGVVAAIPVLATVNADVPLRRGPSRTVDLSIAVGDLGILAAVGLLAVAAATQRSSSREGSAVRRTLGLLGWPGGLLAAFAGWALLGSAFAAHDPTTAAVFGVLQFRYVVYFGVAAALVATGLATVHQFSAALAIAVVGHSAFAIAQYANGEPFGLAYLGETLDETTLGLLWFDQPRGRYLGGLVGNNAAYATVAVPSVAILVWAFDRARGRLRHLAVGAIALIGLLCVPLSQYDSVLIAYTTVLVGSVALATVPAWPERVREVATADRRRALGGLLAAVAATVVAVLAVGAVAVFDALPVVRSKNLGPRLHDYTRAVGLALEYPVFGYGGGNVEPVGSTIGFSDDIAIHSILFSYLAETGFVGAGLWLAAVVATGRDAVRLAWDRGGRDLVGFLCIGAVGFLAVAMIDQVWDNHTSLGVFWLFAGAIVGAYRAERGT